MKDIDISLEDLWFRYTGAKSFVLKSFTWKREEAGIIGLLGTNGCGKTTLLKLIAGTLRPTRGIIQINQKRVKGIKYTQKFVTYVPENAKLFLIGPTPRKDLSRIINNQETVNDLFNQYGFQEMVDKKLYHLSEGQRRLIAYFIAFQMPNKLLLFDEPTIGKQSYSRFITLGIKVSKFP
ncbi:MAG: ATP-binding cassette domain-containing protein [Candidatus Hodarchaeota archaeon]